MGFATVMIKQHTGRTVHLRHDHTFRAVDDESAVARHQGHVAHVNVLLLDIEHGAGFSFLIHFEHDEAQRHLHRSGIGNAALAAFGGVIFRRLKLVIHEIEFGGPGKIADREDAAERLFEAGDIVDAGVRAQELLIAFALNLNQIGHLHGFVDVTKNLADALGLAAGLLGSFRFRRHNRADASSSRVAPTRFAPASGICVGREYVRRAKGRD